MFVKLLLAVVAVQAVSAGALVKRAPITAPAKILEELSNLSGRDFCFQYIGAQVLILPDYSTTVATQTVVKTSNVKATTTTTEIIGTLRKGTATTTIGSTVTVGPSAVNIGETYTTVITTTYTTLGPPSTVTRYSTYPQGGFPRRKIRRQIPNGPIPKPQIPEELADTDRDLIRAACTKVINKYPIYTTSADVKTKSTTISTTSTSTSVIVKVQKSTVISPYSVKTVSGTVTITNTEAATISESSAVTQLATNTYFEPNPAVETITVNQCASESTLPNARMVKGNFAVPGETTYREQDQIYTEPQDGTEMQQRLRCCSWCWSLRWGGGGCLGYKFVRGKCTVVYASLSNVQTPADVCPAKAVGIMLPPPTGPSSGPNGGISEWRAGPCAQEPNAVRTCFQDAQTGLCQAGQGPARPARR